MFNFIKTTIPFIKRIRNFSLEITSSMVKELRTKTNAPMMDCKKALSDPTVNGDIEKAFDWLRAKGIAKAINHSSNLTSEGVIAIYKKFHENSILDSITMMEINCQTDFVSRNTEFHKLICNLITAVDNYAYSMPKSPDSTNKLMIDVPTLLKWSVYDNNNTKKLKTLQEILIESIVSIKENISIRRVLNFRPKHTSLNDIYISSYVHDKLCDPITSNASELNIGTIGSIVIGKIEDIDKSTNIIEKKNKKIKSQINTTFTSNNAIPMLSQTESFNQALHKIAMQVVSNKPKYLYPQDASQSDINREIEIFKEQTLSQEKTIPEEKLEKIIKGKIDKRLCELSLMLQVILNIIKNTIIMIVATNG